MEANKIEDVNFKSDELAIIACETQATEQQLRTYVIKNWKKISKGLSAKSTILFICGVHGGPDETLGGKRKVEYIKNQVILNFFSILYNYEILPNFYIMGTSVMGATPQDRVTLITDFNIYLLPAGYVLIIDSLI